MINTKLFNSHINADLQKFGETDFYLKIDNTDQFYKIMDGTYDSYNCVIVFPFKYGIDIIQDLFNAWYQGYEYGEARGEDNGENHLRWELKKLLDL